MVSMRSIPLLWCLILACAPSSGTPQGLVSGVAALQQGLVPSALAPRWGPARPMNLAHQEHTATLLNDGRLLVVGGDSPAEVFDPATDRWTIGTPLARSRSRHTATLLPNGRVLVAGGEYLDSRSGAVIVPTGVELYDPATGQWSATGELAQGRSSHTATLLPSGQVLLVGGERYEQNGGPAPVASAELYDPDTGVWTPTGSLAVARADHTATLLPTGQVLVTGGEASQVTLTSAELYDPATGRWTATGALGKARADHTATLLPTGQVLAAGGRDDSAELYDPATGTWAPTGPLSESRNTHTATLLPTGQVLVVAGAIGDSSICCLGSAELYDPDTGRWTVTDAPLEERYQHTATLLPTGKVLVVGGGNNLGILLSSTELYDPDMGRWTAAPALGQGRNGHTTTLLGDGRLLVTGGTNRTSGYLASAELRAPATGAWAGTAPLEEARTRHTATLLSTGKVLVAGGEGVSVLPPLTELYDPATGLWAPAGSLAEARVGHTATLLPGDKVLVAGGSLRRGTELSFSSIELYHAATGQWTRSGTLVRARRGHTATLLPDGKVLFAGGYGSPGFLDGAELYDPATGTSVLTGPLSRARSQHTATLLPNGRVLVVGGEGNTGSLASAELYDPRTGLWIDASPLAQARFQHTATLLPDGRVLVVGGQSPTSPLDSAELYDPATSSWTPARRLQQTRLGHTATLLSDGRLLIVGGGGDGTSTELYEYSPAPRSWHPEITAVSPASLEPGVTFTVSGLRLRGLSEASSGTTYSSPTDFPLLTLLPVDRDGWVALPWSRFSGTSVTATLPPSLLPGHYLLVLSAHGLLTSRLLLIQDLSAPETYLDMDLVPRAVTRSTQATLAFSTLEPGASFECSLNGGAFEPCVSPVSMNSLLDGSYSFAVRAVDRNGNADPTPARHTWKVDTGAPQVPTLQVPTPGLRLFTSRPAFSGSAEPGTTVALFIDRDRDSAGRAQVGEDGTWSVELSLPLGPGEHSASVQGIDEADNRSARSAEVPFTIIRRSHYGASCAAAPGAPLAWALLLLGLRRRR